MKTMAADVSGGHHHQLAGLGWAGLGWAGLGWAGLGWAAAFADTFPHVEISRIDTNKN
jgi:hypothetical protein